MPNMQTTVLASSTSADFLQGVRKIHKIITTPHLSVAQILGPFSDIWSLCLPQLDVRLGLLVLTAYLRLALGLH